MYYKKYQRVVKNNNFAFPDVNAIILNSTSTLRERSVYITITGRSKEWNVESTGKPGIMPLDTLPLSHYLHSSSLALYTPSYRKEEIV
jgi:hypothetical protein